MPDTATAAAATPTPVDVRTPVLARRPGIAAGVLGLGTALPAGAVTSAAIAQRLGLDEEWIVSRTGIRSRRIAAPDERLSDLAAQAGAAALADAGVPADELDLVLVATFTPTSSRRIPPRWSPARSARPAPARSMSARPAPASSAPWPWAAPRSSPAARGASS